VRGDGDAIAREAQVELDGHELTVRDFTSTTLADLFTLLFAANPFSAARFAAVAAARDALGIPSG
jgi:hypothetical protein